ncbi:MAG: conjugal transfer protein TraB [Desulfamplus sp.]|nr:conjugal transfer protein TraB [Desulfamplus sp.]MBF0574204.1 conjugal transfer protein TraB [Desulfamplus sp.]
MKAIDENILKATKEIVVKFIEMGRLSPSSIHESFRDIYATINETVKAHETDSELIEKSGSNKKDSK